jgi:DNA-binding IclR family transcriptional regulator
MSTAFARLAAEQGILEELAAAAGSELRVDDLASAIVVPRTTVQKALTQLESQGLVNRVGEGRRGSPYRFRLASAAAEPSSRPSATLSLADLFRQTGGKLDVIAGLDA